jgi:hypothetical protein
MTRLLAGAMALALIGGSAAVAQPYNHDRSGDANQGGDHRGNDQSGDRSDHGGNRGDHGGNWGDRGDRGGGHHRHIVCTYRHHHRVCYRQHW